jgi:hypothetical protein
MVRKGSSVRVRLRASTDTGTAVSDDYTSETSHFIGAINWLQIDVDEASEDEDHLISPEERLRLEMARQ